LTTLSLAFSYLKIRLNKFEAINKLEAF